MAEAIESVLQEARRFAPLPPFRARAKLSDLAEYERLYRQPIDDPDTFWAGVAGELRWLRPWDKALEWLEPVAKWFVGGKTNLACNCLDRHLNSWRRTKAAIIWEGEPGDQRVVTYQDLYREVNRLAKPACAPIGATHSDLLLRHQKEARWRPRR